MTEPRIFVGTMHSNEGDFPRCLKSIGEQEDVAVTHFIVSDLREKEAHNALWRAWRDQRSTHDLFVKVDADTVLATELTLATMWGLFSGNPRVTGLQAPLHDHLTDGFINGLNAFSPTVNFNNTDNELWCDRVDTGHDIVLREKDLPPSLVPAGFHCHSASDRQAFHYGVHRMLKGQYDTLARVTRAWHVDHDRVRAFALIGSCMADRFVENRMFSYADPEFNVAFDEAVAGYDTWVDRLKALEAMDHR